MTGWLAALVAMGLGAEADWRQGYQRTEVGPGVLAFIADESPGGVVQGNITVISGDEFSLVVDSGQYTNLAQAVVRELQEAGVPPVRYLVNTHWHGDHLMANHVFRGAWPDLVVVQHAETARLAAENYETWNDTWRERMDDVLKTIATRLSAGVNRDGEPLTEQQRVGLEVDQRLLSHFVAVSEPNWQPPDLTFERTLALDLGGRKVAAQFLGRGNTPGDVVVWDEPTKTLMTGDLVVWPTPYSFGSIHSDWIETLSAMRAMAPARIVPGHGPVMQDDHYLQRLEALLAETRRQVRAAIDSGAADLAAVRAQVDLSAFETELAGDDPDRVRAFRAFYLTPGIEQAWKEARGEL